jgi:nucleoside-diphosphate-sugar epimerase
MKKLLLTGSSGFLGKNILEILKKNYHVTTLGFTKGEDINTNLSIEIPFIPIIPDIVLHAAGKVHSVPKSNNDKQLFFDINYQGTVNLCKALEKTGFPKSFVFISSVAVYGLDEGENIDESYPLIGSDPYAQSKIQAEKFLSSWCSKNDIKLVILRPSLIAGPNPPGNLGNMIKSIKSGIYFSIKDRNAHKSILMVQDIANLIPLVENKSGIYNVCDSQHPTFNQIEKLISKQLNKKRLISISYNIAKFLAIIGDFLGSDFPYNTNKLKKITRTLTFSNEKAKQELSWKPLNVIEYFKIY